MRAYQWFQRAAWVTVAGLSAPMVAQDAHATELTHEIGLGFSLSFHLNHSGTGLLSGRGHLYYETGLYSSDDEKPVLVGGELGLRGVRGDRNRVEALARVGLGRVDQGPIGHLSLYRADLLLGLSSQLGGDSGLAFGVSGRLGPAQLRVLSADLLSGGGPSYLDLGVEHGFLPGMDFFPFVAVEGRPLRDGGPTRKPRAVGRLEDPRARTWAETGEDELAAVAAFVQLARELAALGAPSELVERCLRAADEEVMHGLLALGRAAQLQDRPVAVAPLRLLPRAFPSRTGALIQLGLESLHDGLRGEGAAASRHRVSASSERDDLEARIHARIATEEQGHATLGGDIAAWCAREGGRPVRQALRACT